MASVEKLPNARWRARYRDPAGRSRSRTFTRKVGSEQFLAATGHRHAVSPLAIKERLGHADVLTTFRKYGHLFKGVQDRLTAQLEETHREALGRISQHDGQVVELHSDMRPSASTGGP